MNIGVWNVLDLVEEYGDELVNALISDFTTDIEKKGCQKTLTITCQTGLC